MATVTMIKKDAQINVSISAGYLFKLQQMLSNLVSERTEEELAVLQEYAKKGELDLPDDWMEHIALITMLIQYIETEADKQGMTYQQDIDSIQPEN